MQREEENAVFCNHMVATEIFFSSTASASFLLNIKK
jgi:hypothetical protein